MVEILEEDGMQILAPTDEKWMLLRITFRMKFEKSYVEKKVQYHPLFKKHSPRILVDRLALNVNSILFYLFLFL